MFPSVIQTFNIVNPSDRLNSPSHSSVHNAVGSVLTQVQTVIGTDASTIGTILGDIHNPLSDGGGHVQSALKGGTGQTTYIKGDLLVGQNSSTLTRLAVSSTTGEILTVDSTQPLGVKWGPATATNKVAFTTTSVVIAVGSIETTLFSSSIPGSVIGLSNAIKFTGAIRKFTAADNFTVRANYGGNEIGSIILGQTNTPGSSVTGGTIQGYLAGVSTSSQLGYLQGAFGNPSNTKLTQGTSSVNSFADQNLVITGQFATAQSSNSILTGLFVVEKIS